MEMRLPKGFRPMSLSTMLVYFGQSMPELAAQLVEHMGVDQNTFSEHVVLLEEQHLIQFAVAADGAPSVFIAPHSEDFNPYGTDADVSFAERLVSFWDQQGKFDPHTGWAQTNNRNIPFSLRSSSYLYEIQTPEGPQHVLDKVAYRLHDLGLITKDAAGDFHAPSKAQLTQATQEHGICDFCSDFTPKHIELVPDFHFMDGSQHSMGGWATCNACHQLIAENRRTDLLRRSIDRVANGKFSSAALTSLHRQFWMAWDAKVDAAGVGAALLDFIEGRTIAEDQFANPKLKEKARRVEAIRQLTGLTLDEMEALGKGDILYKEISRKLSAWRKKFGADGYEGTKKIAHILNTFDQPKMLMGQQPHWQVALDQKISAIARLKQIEGLSPDHPQMSEIHWMDLQEDLAGLKVAEVYSFSADTMHAILAGAQSIPHESSLKSVEVPSVRAGWFWFAEPFPVASSPISSDSTAALLWSWDMTAKTPTLRFSCYVLDDKKVFDGTANAILPSTKWLWPLEATFHEMIVLNTKMYRATYGDTGPFADQPFKIGEEGTMKAIAEFSLFFLMACLWFRQTVPGTTKKIDPKLTQEPVHIERHARKRYEKAYKATPVVRVIALRKSAVTAEPHEATEGKKHHLTVRFVVSGHAKLQPCGPGRKDRKLIWVDPYPKGPENAPFKDSATKIFAVVR